MLVTTTSQGAVKLSEIVNGRLVTKQYFGYTIKEAKLLFRRFCQSQKSKNY